MIPQTLFDALSKVDNDAQATSAMSATVGSDRTAVDMAQGKLTADSSQLASLEDQQAADLKAAQDLLTQLYGNSATGGDGQVTPPLPAPLNTARRRTTTGECPQPCMIPDHIVRQAAARGISLAQLIALLEKLLPLIGPVFGEK